MTVASPIDWDDAYANAPYIPDAAEYPPRWAAQAAAFRANANARLDQPYADPQRARFDLFLPKAKPRGLLIFVHGGYWKAFDRGDWSHLAAGGCAAGWAVALPGYTLAPEASLPQISGQIASAVTQIAAQVDGPVHLVGHSAGGHLVSRMICAPALLSDKVQQRLARVTTISGLHDLRPLLATQMNTVLGLTDATAHAESPALHPRLSGPALTIWVGAQERPEFIRQSQLLAEAWGGQGATDLVIDPERHHFDVIDGLADPGSALLRAVLRAP